MSRNPQIEALLDSIDFTKKSIIDLRPLIAPSGECLSVQQDAFGSNVVPARDHQMMTILEQQIKDIFGCKHVSVSLTGTPPHMFPEELSAQPRYRVVINDKVLLNHMHGSGAIDYDKLQEYCLSDPCNWKVMNSIMHVSPKAFPRQIDWNVLKGIAKKGNMKLVVDATSYLDLISVDAYHSPVGWADLVYTDCTGTFGAPSPKAFIYMWDDDSFMYPTEVMPISFGAAAGLSQCMFEKKEKDAQTKIWESKLEARVFSDTIQQNGYEVVTGGTDSHTVLVADPDGYYWTPLNDAGIKVNDADKYLVLNFRSISEEIWHYSQPHKDSYMKALVTKFLDVLEMTK